MLRPGHIAWLPLALLAAAWPGSLQAGRLEKVWEVDLRRDLQGAQLDPGQSFKVRNLSFSPDGRQIAVGVGGATVLLRVQDPNTVVRQFPAYGSFGWSPDGQIIHSGIHIVHLTDGKACDLPQFAGSPRFIGNGSMVAMSLDASPVRKFDPHAPLPRIDFDARHLEFFDADCQKQGSWEVPPQYWLIRDASPDRGLLSIAAQVGSKRRTWDASLIVNPFTRKILYQGWAGRAPGGWFADRDSAVCAGNICWDVDTGKEIGRAASGFVTGLAARSSRVVLTDHRESVIPFSSAFTELASRRMIWDFRSGKELVSWRLQFLTYSSTFDLDGFSRDREPIPCAISPDGEYIVEGGDGKIWLYKIQP